MIGRRLVLADGQDPYHLLERPGDYCGPAVRGSDPRPWVWFIVPEPLLPAIDDDDADRIKSLAGCAMPPHVFRECPDGSLEIREGLLVTQRTVDQDEPLSLSPSLYCDPARGGCGLHGFIRNGSWS